MNRTPEIFCSACNRMFSDRSGAGVCPDCGKNAGCAGHPPEPDSGHVRDFRRYSFLCELLRMFSAEYGFGYSVNRKGSLIEIWLRSETGTTFLSLDMEDSEPAKSEKMNRIIRRIVNFSQ